MLKSYIRHRMADNEIDDITVLMEISGVSRNSINKLYRSNRVETIKIETLIKLCDALNCELSALVQYNPDISKETILTEK
jgi:putative transcriptional regulator